MKALILPVAALVIGMVGGTAWTVTTWEAPPAEAPADSSQVAEHPVPAGTQDSAHAGPAGHDHAAPDEAEPAAVAADAADAGIDPDTASDVSLAPSDSGPTSPSSPGAAPAPDTLTEPAAAARPGVMAGAESLDARAVRALAGEENEDAGTDLRARPMDGAKQLARIFAAMQPRDAAAVLGRMTDPEITAILDHIQPRQAASILSSMDEDRAAVLSRSVLGGGAP